MSTNTLADPDRIAQALDAFPDTFLNLSRDEQQVSLAIYRLLATGEPAPPGAIAAEAGVAVERVGELLDRWIGVYRDAEGRVVGYWGLALSEMNHRLEVAGRTVYAWCAWDTLFIPALLGQTAAVTSKSPETGEAIHLTVSPEGASSAGGTDVYVSFLEPDEEKLAEDVIGAFCHYVFFFASLEEGQQWTTAHPGTYLLTLEQAFELGRRKNARQYPDALADASERPRAVLFEGDLQLQPDAARLTPEDDPARKYMGSGNGTVQGQALEGTVRWDLFERQGDAVCDTRFVGVIETADGARIRFEAVDLFLRSDAEADTWRLAAGLRFQTDDAAYAWLEGSLATWEGVTDLQTYQHHYQVFAPGLQ